MILSFRHKGLRLLFEHGDQSKVPPKMVDRLENRLSRMAADIRDLNAPGYFLHQLTGSRKGFWSIRVSANWCIIFQYIDGDIYNVDLLDYH